jgi:hypothetical protein
MRTSEAVRRFPHKIARRALRPIIEEHQQQASQQRFDQSESCRYLLSQHQENSGNEAAKTETRIVSTLNFHQSATPLATSEGQTTTPRFGPDLFRSITSSAFLRAHRHRQIKANRAPYLDRPDLT